MSVFPLRRMSDTCCDRSYASKIFSDGVFWDKILSNWDPMSGAYVQNLGLHDIRVNAASVWKTSACFYWQQLHCNQSQTCSRPAAKSCWETLLFLSWADVKGFLNEVLQGRHNKTMLCLVVSAPWYHTAMPTEPCHYKKDRSLLFRETTHIPIREKQQSWFYVSIWPNPRKLI